ncbi:MAG TPA: hypothetical protein VF995_10170, partial [Actinomycetota bacterium]
MSDDDDRMEYDDFVWDPSEGGRPPGQEPDPAPWRQPFSWETPQQPEPERDPFRDTGPLDPYPPIGGPAQSGGPAPGNRDRQRFWRSDPEPPLPPDDGGSLNGHTNGHTNGHNGHGGFDDSDAGGRYADFTEALIERLADGVADPHTDPRLPRQPPPPQ